MAPRALITGITGQDGSYLAEFLLDKGYEVIGMVRRSSTVNFERIAHIQERLTLVPGDLLDEVSMINILRDHRPTEVYNLAAQSFVQTSWSQPVLTGETTALSVTRMLDAIRIVDPDIRFYQASSSEMFGKVVEVPQRESTPFYPRSPYGVAKVYGHWITVNYRESYGLHASSGILFNHESVPAGTPVVVRRHGYVDILPIGDVIPHRSDPKSGRRYTSDGGDYEVWDGERWATCLARTAYWHDGDAVTVHGRGGVVTSTPDHVVFLAEGEREAQRVEPGERLRLATQPPASVATTLTEDESWLLGILAAEGHVSTHGRATITCGDESVLAEAAACWSRVAAGTSRKEKGPQLVLAGNPAYLKMIRSELYTRDGHKRVPKRVLNAGAEQHAAFLTACVVGEDASPVLACALNWMQRTAPSRPGSHIRVCDPGREGVVEAVTRCSHTGWMCDLATDSDRFAAGVGLVVVHNSPRRGLEFVTRKISHGAARIKHGLDNELCLGNLDAQRDWGFAGDYVRAMWLMLQQPEPDDFVVAMGETHSVREFCELAFGHVGLDYREFVKLDERYVRPAEVDLLIGDPARARATLGWTPDVSFAELVRMMVDNDVELLAR